MELWDHRISKGESPFSCAKCSHPNFSSNIDGIPRDDVYCEHERRRDGKCKVEGKLWENRHELPTFDEE